MNEELTLAVEQLRQYQQCRAWFIPVRLSPCDLPDIDIGGGVTLRDIQAVDLYPDWAEGLEKIIAVLKPTPRRLRMLLAALESDENGVRTAAFAALREAGFGGAESMLRRVACSEADPLRKDAIEALGDVGGSLSIFTLRGVLTGDETGQLTWAAIRSLVKIGCASVTVLGEIAADATSVARESAILALGELPACPSVTGPLERALRDPDPSIRSLAVRSLQLVGGGRAIKPLRATLADNTDWVRHAAAKAVLLLTSSVDIPTAASLDLSCEGNIPHDTEVFRKIVSLGSQGVPALVHAWKHQPQPDRLGAGMLLREIGLPAVPEDVWSEIRNLPIPDYTDYSIPC